MQNIFSSLLLYIYSKYNSNMECAKIIQGKIKPKYTDGQQQDDWSNIYIFRFRFLDVNILCTYFYFVL